MSAHIKLDWDPTLGDYNYADVYALLDTIDELKIELMRNNYSDHDVMACCRVCIYCSFDYTRHCKCRPLYYPFYGLQCTHHADCKCPLNCRGGNTCLYKSLDELLLIHRNDDNYNKITPCLKDNI